MSGESFDGSANRETHALVMWLSNDEGLYLAALDVAEQALRRTPIDSMPDAARVIGEALFVWVDDSLFSFESLRLSRELTAMRDEVGSLWRVDRDELGAAFIPSEHGR